MSRGGAFVRSYQDSQIIGPFHRTVPAPRPEDAMSALANSVGRTLEEVLSAISAPLITETEQVAGRLHGSAVHQVAYVLRISGGRQRRARCVHVRANCSHGTERLPAVSMGVPSPGSQRPARKMDGRQRRARRVCMSGPMFSGWLMALPALFSGVPSGR